MIIGYKYTFLSALLEGGAVPGATLGPSAFTPAGAGAGTAAGLRPEPGTTGGAGWELFTGTAASACIGLSTLSLNSFKTTEKSCHKR